MARSTFSVRDAVADSQNESEDVCFLCGTHFCDQECELGGEYFDAGWYICDEGNPDGTTDSLDTVSYLSCLQQNSSAPPPRHPATASLGDLLRLRHQTNK